MNKIIFFLFMLINSILAFAQQFSEVSDSLGINHYAENLFLIGGGVGFADFNNDGWEDLYVSGGDLVDKIYMNNGGNGFTEAINAGIGLTVAYTTNGIAIGDINNDGFKDIFVTTGLYQNGTTNLLFLNNGNATFTNITFTAGFLNDAKYSIAATFGDYNLDGFLDLYVSSYVDSLMFELDSYGNISNFGHIGQENSFYLNNGNLTFTEVSETYNLNDAGNALAVASTDFDMDFDCDIYLANDFGESTIPNCFFENDLSNGTFNCLSPGNGSDIGIFAMGIAVGDYDEDLDLDYYVTNLGANAFLSNNFDDTFTDLAQINGTANNNVDSVFATSWGTAFLDVNNNTYLDLYVSNGNIPAAQFIANAEYDPNKLFLNNGDGTFTEVSDSANIAVTERGRGMAYADFDNDGDLDIANNNIYQNFDLNRTFSFFRNDNNSGNWIKLDLEGTINNRDAYGAKVFITFDNRTLMREVDGGSSHASKHSDIIHFGLDTATFIDNISVMWPGGAIQNFGSSNVNVTLDLLEDVNLYPIVAPSIIIEKKYILVKSAPLDSIASIANYTTNSNIIFTNFSGNEIYSTKLPGIHQLPIWALNAGTYFITIVNLDNMDIVYQNLFTIP